MSEKVLIVAATAGFIKAFLVSDMLILKDMGYEVHCAANGNNNSGTGTDFKSYFADLDFQFHQIDFSSSKPFTKQSITAYFQIKKLLKEDYAFIHCHTPIAGLLTRLATRKKRKVSKIAYTTHGFYFHKGSDRKTKFIYYHLEDLGSYLTDTMITINKEDYNAAQTMHCKDVRYINGVGVNIGRIDSARGINVNEYRKKIGLSEDDIMILSVGELSKRKNHQVIIRALANLDKNFVYVIVGKAMVGAGTYEYLKNLAQNLEVRIIFLGFRQDVPELCQCADIGAIPSLREGLGLAGIELLASGTPIVGSNVHGIVDYLHDGINGYACSPNDVEGFANSINKLKDKDIRAGLADACRQSAQPFSIECSEKQRKQIYRDILQTERGWR